MAEDQQNPFLALRPPASDAFTYLTFIEHNLTEENLPVLHKVLQDAELTSTIGWDLVMMLLPLVPASEECLQDIARLGNAKEVILKVSEALRFLELDGLEDLSADGSDDEDEALSGGVKEPGNPKDTSAEPHAPTIAGSETQVNATPEQQLPIPVRQFKVLIHMLSILHPRLKVARPSAFLSSTLQAIIAAFSKATAYTDDLAQEIIAFVKTASGTKRPHLPPRRSTSDVLSRTNSGGDVKFDPPHAEDDVPMQKRLLSSFITHILEDYMLSLTSSEDIPGLAWSSRLFEKKHPERQIPGKMTFAERFANDDDLHRRLDTMGQIVALARDLGISSKELIGNITDATPEATGHEGSEDEPPNKPEDIPLAKKGSLFLLAARHAASVLYDRPSRSPQIPLFPTHGTLLSNFIGLTSPATTGLESEALLDTLLFLGLLALERNDIGAWPPNDNFNEYLQTASLISANCPSPTLRYHAHYLTATVLRSHPDDLVRLSFIKDTLEHCPYSNLRVSAITWLKGETLEANPPKSFGNITSATPSAAEATPTSTAAAEEDDETRSEAETSIFATHIALSELSPYLFPDLSANFLPAASPALLAESYAHFRQELSFHLASLNFLYLLLRAGYLHQTLQVPQLVVESDIGGSYLGPLRKGIESFGGALGEQSGELAEAMGLSKEDVMAATIELELLRDAVDRCAEGIKGLQGWIK